jgi:hypothetical protein
MNKIDKKFNKRKNRKKKEMFLEDYAKENNINLNLSINYGSSPEKTNKSDTQSNSQDSNKFDDYDINKNKLRTNLNLKKYNSASTNNSSTDDDIKEKDKCENKFEKVNMKNVINPLDNRVKEFQLNDKTYNYNNEYYIYSTLNNAKINKRLFNGVKQYYTNIGENNNNNNFINIDNSQAKIYIRNYQNACLNNYLNTMNMKIYCYNDYIYKYNLNNCLQKIKENEKTLDTLKSQIILLENQTLHDMILSSQMTNLINYIKKKTNISNIDNNNIKFCNQPEHPYFYTNHNEEIRVKFILYLIEGLFFEEHLTHDYTLLNLLDRDGYASLTKLEKHPQLVYSKISVDSLKPVFLEHRQNEVTETVETFDDILIRNKDWKNIKRKGKLETRKIEQNLLNEMGKIKLAKIQNLMGRKSELIQIQDKLYFRYHVMTQQIKQFQSHFNKINNFYNYQANIFKNNNVYNVYNNNIQKKFGY